MTSSECSCHGPKNSVKYIFYIPFIFQTSPVWHRMCVPLFLHHLFFYHTKDLFSLLSPLVCSGHCKTMFWWNFSVSNFPPVPVPSVLLSASPVIPLSGGEPLLPACLMNKPIHHLTCVNGARMDRINMPWYLSYDHCYLWDHLLRSALISMDAEMQKAL